jgi:hypothetical protein
MGASIIIIVLVILMIALKVNHQKIQSRKADILGFNLVKTSADYLWNYPYSFDEVIIRGIIMNSDQYLYFLAKIRALYGELQVRTGSLKNAEKFTSELYKACLFSLAGHLKLTSNVSFEEFQKVYDKLIDLFTENESRFVHTIINHSPKVYLKRDLWDLENRWKAEKLFKGVIEEQTPKELKHTLYREMSPFAHLILTI